MFSVTYTGMNLFPLWTAKVCPTNSGRMVLARLVTDHVFRHVHRDELLPVVHRHRMAHHLGHHGRTARPGFDDPLLVDPVHPLDFLEEERVDEGALLQ